MKKKITVLLALVFALAVCATCIACDKPQTHGTLSVADISLIQGESKAIELTFSGEEYEANYSFAGENIVINDGVVTGLVQGTTTVVTVSTEHHCVSFQVTVLAKGTMAITVPDFVYLDYPAKEIVATFSVPEYAQEVNYEVKGVPTGVSVAVEDGKVFATGSLIGSGEKLTQMVTLTATSADGLFTVTKPLTIAQYNGAGYNGNSLNLHTRAKGLISEMEAYSGVEGGEKGGTIFIGDSFFDGFWNSANFRSYYEGENVYRFGISSSTLSDWLIFAERVVFPFEPKNIVIHCGTNDYYDDRKTAAQIVDMAVTLFESFRDRIPDVKVWYFGIEPRYYSASGMQPYEVPKSVNTQLALYAQENSSWLTYIDSPAWCFTDDTRTQVKVSFFSDGTHPTTESYAYYVAALEQAGMVTTDSAAVLSGSVLGFETTKASTVGTTTRAIYAGGKTLKTEYVLSGKIDITELDFKQTNVTNNPHVEFALSSGYRFLWWDNDCDGAIGVGWQANGYVNENANGGVEQWVWTGSTMTVPFQILVTNKDAFFFSGDKLQAVMYNVPNLTRGFMIGSEHMGIKVYDMVCARKGDESGAYEEMLEKAEVQECAAGTMSGNNLYSAIAGVVASAERYVAGNMGKLTSVAYSDDFVLKGANENSGVYTGTQRDWVFTKDGNAVWSGDFAFTYNVQLLDASSNPLSSISAYSFNSFFVVTAAEYAQTAGSGVWGSGHHLLYWKKANATSAIMNDGLNTTLATGQTGTSFTVTTVRSGNVLYLALDVDGYICVKTVNLTDESEITLWIVCANWDMRITGLSFSQEASAVTSALQSIGK